MLPQELIKHLGNIDIYLLDLILKGRVSVDNSILDAGCGEGRNIVYFLHNAYKVYGVDENPTAVKLVQMMSRSLQQGYETARFSCCDISQMPFEDKQFGLVISGAVLHFSRDVEHFFAMIDEMYRVLALDGNLFIRMASVFGMESQIEPVSEHKYLLPDGSTRFLLTPELRKEIDQRYNFRYQEPLKTAVVENTRSMSTLVLQKV